MRVAVLAITRHGIALGGRIVAALPDACLLAPEKFAAEAAAAAPGASRTYAGRTAAQVPALFAAFDGIVCVVSLGAVVRLIAPLLGDKTRDPAVVVVDEAGRFAIPVLSGHLGGANALSGRLAAALGATPVLTTASDALQTLAVDLLGREFGWTLEAENDTLLRACAAMVNEAPVACVQEAGRTDWWHGHANGRAGALPANLRMLPRLEAVDAALAAAPDAFAAVLWISRRPLPPALAARLAGRLVTYRPPAEQP